MNKARRFKAKRRRRLRVLNWRLVHFWELAKLEFMPALHADINRERPFARETRLR